MIAHRKMIPPPTKWPSRQGRRDWMTASALHRVCRMLTANAEPARLHSRPGLVCAHHSPMSGKQGLFAPANSCVDDDARCP